LRRTRTHEDCIAFYKTVKQTQRAFFNLVIHSTVERARTWDLNKWIKPRPLSTLSQICDPSGISIESFDHFTRACSEQFLFSDARAVDLSIVGCVLEHPPYSMPLFNALMVKDALSTTSNHSAPGLDHISWRVLKQCLNEESFTWLAKVFSSCVSLSVWLSVFKSSCTIIIPKPHKPDYSILKAYRCHAYWAAKPTSGQVTREQAPHTTVIRRLHRLHGNKSGHGHMTKERRASSVTSFGVSVITTPSLEQGSRE
jgi:hypothetical protein